MYIINVSPHNTRINDRFVNDSLINCDRPDHDITSSIVVGSANDTPFQADFYKRIALDIVVETVFNYPYPYISEKTLRPLSCKRMFIIVGAPNTLELLKNKGFETWSDIVDESYDKILDNELRFLTVMKSIRHFCLLPLCEVKQYMKANQDRLEHNYQQLIALKNIELAQLSQRLRV